MEGILELFGILPPDLGEVFIAAARIAAPVLMALILWRCGKPLLSFRKEPEIWAWLHLADGSRRTLTHWENVIGRHPVCDVVLPLQTVSRHHAVLTRYDDGSWTIADTGSKSGVTVNGEKVTIAALNPETDVINLGGLDMKLVPISKAQEAKLATLRTKASTPGKSALDLLLLTVLQMLCGLCYLFSGTADAGDILLGFGGITAAQWALLLFYTCIRRSSYEVETIAFFLCTMGMNVIMSTVSGEAFKQLIAMALGLGAFLFLGWTLRDLERAKKVRYAAAVAGVALLVVTLLFGQEINGAKNWLIIGGYSIQPSELSKVCFVFVGASAMDRILQRRNLIGFIVYSAVLCGLLAIMNDFGTALVFFVAFLSIAYMRSGSVGTIGLAITSLGFAGVIALKIAPHALRRFSIWRHVWEDPLDRGYQQVRCLMCISSGGLLGLGAGKGWMKEIFASDTDIVFATVSEEWGLIAAMMMVAAVTVLALFCLRSATLGRSSFYTIGACTAASILLVQTALNVLGTVDLLPFTGVTFPFVSNGGSSMLSAWALMAFVKAADTRQNASFAVKLEKHKPEKRKEVAE